MWMNSYEIRDIADRFDVEVQPNAERGARILLHLHVWTNNNSDGWSYWKKPSNAAERLMIELDRVKNPRGFSDAVDLTDAELAGALRPIKAFLTRQKVDAETKEWIVDPDASARRIARQMAAERQARAEALHEEARQYARGIVSNGSARLVDMIADAYMAGAKR